jgi:hypothetical protein
MFAKSSKKLSRLTWPAIALSLVLVATGLVYTFDTLAPHPKDSVQVYNFDQSLPWQSSSLESKKLYDLANNLRDINLDQIPENQPQPEDLDNRQSSQQATKNTSNQEQQRPLVSLEDLPKYDNLWYSDESRIQDFINVLYQPNETNLVTPSELSTQNYIIESPYSIPTGFVDTSLDLDNPYGAFASGTSFTVTFDSPPDDDLMRSMRFMPEVDFNYSINGNTATITPTERMGRLQNYSFGMHATGICAGDMCGQPDSWYYRVDFRTSIYERYVYGTSAEGRELVAHLFGNSDSSGKRIMLTGGTHGEEWHAGGLWMFVDYLKANPQEMFGRNKTMIIIPRVNADGIYRNETFGDWGWNARYNAQGVNLNRNFPTSWTPCAWCGSGPASAPEVSSLVNFTLAENVTHMIAYHNQWPPVGIIFLGDNDNSYTRWWSRWVADRTGYPLGIYDGPETNQTSSGDVPGDQVVWAESVGIRGLLIEGSYRGVTDYNKNFPMYLALVRDF